jgi:drug/metabolite transporter (DMT)-like permease
MRITWKAAFSAIGISVLWGGNIVAIKIALYGIGPMLMAALTFSLGALSIFLWTRFNKIPIGLAREEIGKHLMNGLLFAVQVALFYVGAKMTSASHAVILTNTNIFFVALLAHFFILNDQLTWLKILGLILAFCGIAYLFLDQPSPDSPVSLSGNLIVLLSAFLLGARIIYLKRLVEGIDASKLVLWQMFVGVPFFYLFALIDEGIQIYSTSLSIWTAVLYQGIVVAGFSFVASTLLLKNYPPTTLSSFFFAVPVSGVVLSYWILGEGLTQHILVSVILVAFGIWLVNLREQIIVD